jgi:hypothetical protein
MIQDLLALVIFQLGYAIDVYFVYHGVAKELGVIFSFFEPLHS